MGSCISFIHILQGCFSGKTVPSVIEITSKTMGKGISRPGPKAPFFFSTRPTSGATTALFFWGQMQHNSCCLHFDDLVFFSSPELSDSLKKKCLILWAHPVFSGLYQMVECFFLLLCRLWWWCRFSSWESTASLSVALWSLCLRLSPNWEQKLGPGNKYTVTLNFFQNSVA